jgi:hypothetical protein
MTVYSRAILIELTLAEIEDKIASLLGERIDVRKDDLAALARIDDDVAVLREELRYRRRDRAQRARRD